MGEAYVTQVAADASGRINFRLEWFFTQDTFSRERNICDTLGGDRYSAALAAASKSFTADSFSRGGNICDTLG